MSDDVISFSKKTSEIKDRVLGVKNNKFNKCEHSYTLINEHTKMMECKSCGFIMSPYDYVLGLAKKEKNIFNNLKYAKIERDNLEVQVVDLKKTLISLKGKVKRVCEKIGLKSVELQQLERK